MITTADKLRCAQHALIQRYAVYPVRVRKGLMSKAQMDHELACMEAIMADYAALLAGEPQLPLFATTPEEPACD